MKLKPVFHMIFTIAENLVWLSEHCSKFFVIKQIKVNTDFLCSNILRRNLRLLIQPSVKSEKQTRAITSNLANISKSPKYGLP